MKVEESTACYIERTEMARSMEAKIKERMKKEGVTAKISAGHRFPLSRTESHPIKMNQRRGRKDTSSGVLRRGAAQRSKPSKAKSAVVARQCPHLTPLRAPPTLSIYNPACGRPTESVHLDSGSLFDS